MSDHNHCSETETQNAQNIIALTELLCQKGILNKTEIDRIFTAEFETESHDFVGKFPLDLLPESAEFAGESPEIIDACKQRINKLMQKFSIPGKIVDCISNSDFINYKIALAPEGNVNTFHQLQKDICLALDSRNIRILLTADDHVIIEVPTSSFQPVKIRQILESEEWKNTNAKIPLAIGKNTFGKPVIYDLGQIHHLLIVGTADCGKNALLNSIVISLLHKFSPNELTLKIYTLQHRTSICRKVFPWPSMQMFHFHRKRMMKELSDLVDIIDQRYEKITDAGLADLTEYNNFFQDHPMPRCVIIIDNAGKLMSEKEAIRLIAKIAQRGSNVGIYLILATMHTGINVISGVIKNLFPTRLCFKTTSMFDSHVVLDAFGAENLCDNGDMLTVTDSCMKIERVHGTFAKIENVRSIVNFILRRDSMNAISANPKNVEEETDDDPDEISQCTAIASLIQKHMVQEYMLPEDDDIMLRALEEVILERETNPSHLQLLLNISYNRAVELSEIMKEFGVVESPSGREDKHKILFFTAH